MQTITSSDTASDHAETKVAKRGVDWAQIEAKGDKGGKV